MMKRYDIDEIATENFKSLPNPSKTKKWHEYENKTWETLQEMTQIWQCQSQTYNDLPNPFKFKKWRKNEMTRTDTEMTKWIQNLNGASKPIRVQDMRNEKK